MIKNNLVSPVVKWVGGKRQLLPILSKLLPKKITTYCEPFVGGGALFFWRQPENAIINDINIDLIKMYETIRDNVEELIVELETHKNDSTYFYTIRDWDRDKINYSSLSNVQKAARLIYLNKTCYNGLFRVNNAGEFNTPFGNYKNPNISNPSLLRAVHKYFNDANIIFSSCDYSDVLSLLQKNSFVYLDPPYDPISTTANFTGYTKGGFSKNDQLSLKKCCDELTTKGIKFMMSNSSTDFIHEQYKNYNITIVPAKRTINSNSALRGKINEVVIRNYD